MLQVISGKFYKNPERYSTPAKGITFSNYHAFSPIITCVATLEPVAVHSTSTSSYVINYTNVIEMPRSNRQLAMVQVGDEKIVRQFELLCIFGLRAFFDGDRQAVETNCRAKPSQATELYVPSQYVSRYCDPNIVADPGDIARFTTFVEKVIGLPRKQYTAVMNALEAFAHSLEVLNYQLDLAYSMLVYSLESLCQTFDEFTPTWEHYDEKVRKELDQVLVDIPADKASAIRETLLKSSFLRLRRRFLGFASKYIKPSFYIEEAAGRQHAVKQSQLERSLGNAYDMRSGYVHELLPILKQLRHPHIANGDIFPWENEPYLTYSGLLRVVHHVIDSFITAQPVVATEDYNWLESVPGLMEFQLAPEYWIGIADKFTPAQARPKLSGLLAIIQRMYASPERVGIQFSPLVKKLASVLGQGGEVERSATLALYTLILHFFPQDEVPGRIEEVKKKYEGIFRRCCVEMMLVWMMTENDGWPWNADESAAAVEGYFKTKFQKTAISVPNLLELCLYAEVANRYLAVGNMDGYEKWVQIALVESPGITVVQEYIKSTNLQKERIEPQQIITLLKGFGAAVDNASKQPSDPVQVTETMKTQAGEVQASQELPVANHPATIEAAEDDAVKLTDEHTEPASSPIDLPDVSAAIPESQTVPLPEHRSLQASPEIAEAKSPPPPEG
jgi:hypothetical protein